MSWTPKHYTLFFDVNVSQFIFSGTTVIECEITKTTKKIELDALEMSFNECVLKKGDTVIETHFEYLEHKGKIEIGSKKALLPGLYTLKLVYQGTINDHLAGFYRSKYQYKKKEHYIATTQFEAADARRAFPCIDHPSYKATYDITIACESVYTALSNTLPKKEYIQDRKRYTEFERTPYMSTYLVYLGVGDFEIKETKHNNVLIRGITTKGQSEHTSFALEWTKKCLDYFEEFFGHSYPLKKLDLIGVPDFASGAMENWGAITFRETALLYYEGSSAIATKQRVAEVVAHELVHQWFGNLVTMKWWDDLWLNESFATYMAYKAMAHYFPDWSVWTEYVTYSSFGGMALDSLNSSHPIHVAVGSVDEIDELFDEIAYEKGGSVLRMLDHYLGENSFKKGLQRYIKTFRYSNAVASDLWSSLEKESNKPVSVIMQQFIQQVGFPVVSVEENKAKIKLSQKRFLYVPTKDTSKWTIPLVIKTGTVTQRELLDQRTMTMGDSAPKKAVIANSDYAGFYITRYNASLLKRLGENKKDMNEREVLGLIHDLFSLVLAQQEDLPVFLSYLEAYFYDESDYEVLAYVIGKLLGIYKLLRWDTIAEVCTDLAKEALMKTGYEPNNNEDVHVTDLRNVSLSALIQARDKDGLGFAQTKFAAYLKNARKLHPDLKAVVYAGAVSGDTGNYLKVKNLYEKAESEEERVKFLHALTAVDDESLLEETLNYCLSSYVRFSNSLYILAGVSSNKKGKELLYSWFMQNWNELKKRTGGHSKTILRRLMKIVLPVCGIGHEKQIETFLRQNPIVGLEQTYRQIKEELLINSRFVKKYKR